MKYLRVFNISLCLIMVLGSIIGFVKTLDLFHIISFICFSFLLYTNLKISKYESD